MISQCHHIPFRRMTILKFTIAWQAIITHISPDLEIQYLKCKYVVHSSRSLFEIVVLSPAPRKAKEVGSSDRPRHRLSSQMATYIHTTPIHIPRKLPAGESCPLVADRVGGARDKCVRRCGGNRHPTWGPGTLFLLGALVSRPDGDQNVFY